MGIWLLSKNVLHRAYISPKKLFVQTKHVAFDETVHPYAQNESSEVEVEERPQNQPAYTPREVGHTGERNAAREEATDQDKEEEEARTAKQFV